MSCRDQIPQFRLTDVDSDRIVHQIDFREARDDGPNRARGDEGTAGRK